jgi:pimeloyl-ACP methyl ester carboxylesterase
VPYRAEIQAAQRALGAQRRNVLRSARFGTIEYAVRGDGPPMLVSHPLLGVFDIGLTIAELYGGAELQMIAPSRFGYLGSSPPDCASAAVQADAFATLLDALCVDRVSVFGYSAGGPAAMQFALRHPDRTAALGLLAPPLPGKTGRPPKPVGNFIFGSDASFWGLKQYFPLALARILGMPKHFQPTANERALLEARATQLFPIKPRKRGALFDVYVSTPSVQTLSLDELQAPIMLINARDDALSAFDNALSAANRIPDVKFIPFEQGGHLLLGREGDLRVITEPFFRSAMESR